MHSGVNQIFFYLVFITISLYYCKIVVVFLFIPLDNLTFALSFTNEHEVTSGCQRIKSDIENTLSCPGCNYLFKVKRETLEQDVKMFKVKNKAIRTMSAVVLVSLLLTLNIFHTLLYYFCCKRYESKCRLCEISITTQSEIIRAMASM